MQRRVLFTEEERQEDIKDVEEMLRNNLSCNIIAEELGRSGNYIRDIRKYLNKEGILTEDELEQIALEKLDEKNREFDIKVLNLRKAGKSKRKICSILHSSNKTVTESYKRLSKFVDLSEYKTEEELLEEERLEKIKAFVNDGTGSKYIYIKFL